jgi:uncharacterized protein (DUF924 family)
VAPDWVADVLHFWFEEVGEAHWFAGGEKTDARIRDRFLSLHSQLAHEIESIGTDPRALLAAVIVFDQFSRHLYRGTPRAFATDDLACRVSRAAIDRGLDVGLSKRERMFLYLPFEHSESREDQALAVALIGQLGNEEWTRYAEEHQALIERFGRFPHRNRILNRASSAAELAVLQNPPDWSSAPAN